jgi:hypothetical protein
LELSFVHIAAAFSLLGFELIQQRQLQENAMLMRDPRRAWRLLCTGLHFEIASITKGSEL